jgi:hypothetical protein
VTRNMSDLDRGLRLFILVPLAIIVSIAAGATSILGIALLALAAFMLVVSAVGFCPIYTLFHFTTRRHRPLPH